VCVKVGKHWLLGLDKSPGSQTWEKEDMKRAETKMVKVSNETSKTVANADASSSNQAKPRLGDGNYRPRGPTL
jgi:hypothetical protein